MYNSYYNYFKAKYGEKVKLCYTDTDSFILEIKTDDLYEDIAPDISTTFDMSGYPKEHSLYSQKNKKVIGMFKYELNGEIMTEFVGLRAKMYAYKKLIIKRDKNKNPILNENGNLIWKGSDEERRCKGIRKSVIKNELHFNNFKKCLDTGEKQYKRMRVFRTYAHNMYTEEVNKIALSSDDDKRYILDDKIHTLAWGHYKIEHE